MILSKEDSSKTLYQWLGESDGIQKLVHEFYHIMDTNPDYLTIRNLHPKNLKTSEEKLILFLTGWSGGPPVYVQKYGHPRLRARHLPFAIGDAERDQWLSCMKEAMSKTIEREQVRDILYQALLPVADFMRNK